MQFDTERSGRQSILYDGQWSVADSDIEVDVLAFYLFDQRRGPASIQSQNIQVDAEREGAFAALRLANDDTTGWEAGVNAFFARRSVLRSDAAENPLTDLNERFTRLNGWGNWLSRETGMHSLRSSWVHSFLVLRMHPIFTVNLSCGALGRLIGMIRSRTFAR